jgi:NAD(P)H dehydrogenase (quinone)
MLLVTGATGQLGRATLEFLLKKPEHGPLAALVRSPHKAGDLQARGVDVRAGDYRDRASLVAAFHAIDTLVFISGSDLHERAQQHRNVVEAAREAGVGHVIYTSFLKGSPATKFRAGLDHVETEKAILASGLTYTIMRNTFYADILPMLLGHALETRQWSYPSAGARLSLATRRDMAEALANVAADPVPHANRIYEISPGEALSFAEIAALLTARIGQPVTYTDIPVDSFKAGLTEAGLPEPAVTAIAGIAEAIAAGELDSSDPTLERLLGRKPVNLKTFIDSYDFAAG